MTTSPAPLSPLPNPASGANSAKVTQVLLAGRKLLLADDSITIQKVVELTFSDEGVDVVSVSNGREAIERLEEFQPDIVLADVFMPQVNGYELCEYIKQNEKLKHIPVMLLVGSFEPFNESEARRVGADDTLTKPFQSIRRLLEKVGLLAEERQSEEMIPTAEFPKVDQPEPQLTDKELEITTADTRPLTPEMSSMKHSSGPLDHQKLEPTASSTTDEAKMEPKVTDMRDHQQRTASQDELLDLGDFHQGNISSAEDFVLDIDLDETPETTPVERYPAYAGRGSLRTTARDLGTAGFTNGESTATIVPDEQPVVSEPSNWTVDQFAKTQEFPRPLVDTVRAPESSSAPLAGHEAQPASKGSAGELITLEQLSPETIDAIAKRAVEQLSEKAVQEIAWEVVPQLAELLIKRQLEEKSP